MMKHIDYTQARQILLDLPVRLETETSLLDESLGRIVSKDIFAQLPMPPFDRSPFDGYVFRVEDIPGKLRVTGTLAAGDSRLPPLEPGTALRIFTGAPVPMEAGAVARQEDTESDGETVTIPKPYAPGTNIVRAGEDKPVGTLLAAKGTRIGPGHLGVLASQGLCQIPVYRKPKALLISTGSEVVSPGEERPPYSIYNSSYYSLSAYLQRMGFRVIPGGIVEDDPEIHFEAVKAAMDSDADLVLTTGGASVGDYDFAFSTAKRVGAEPLFWKVNMKPGGALLAAVRGEKLLLSLSGNPAAALMSILVVAQPYLRKLTGMDLSLQELRLPLWNPLPKTSSAYRMLRGRLRIEKGKAYFEENPGRHNSDLSSFEHCDLIGIVPGGNGMLEAGEEIEVLHLPYDVC